MRADTRDRADRHESAHVRFEPLRDQIFAACGYALVVAALATELLARHLGKIALATGIVLAVVLVPANLFLIRRFARPRRSLAAQHAVNHTGRREQAAPPKRTP